MALREKLAIAALAGTAFLTGCDRAPQPLSVFTTAATMDKAVDFIVETKKSGLYMVMDSDSGAGRFLVFDSAGTECAPCGRYPSHQDVPQRFAQTDLTLNLLNEAAQQLVLETRRFSPGDAPFVVLQLYYGDPGINDARYGNRTLIFNSSAAAVTCTYNSIPAEPGPYQAACVPNDTLTPSAQALVKDNPDVPLLFKPGITAPQVK